MGAGSLVKAKQSTIPPSASSQDSGSAMSSQSSPLSQGPGKRQVSGEADFEAECRKAILAAQQAQLEHASRVQSPGATPLRISMPHSQDLEQLVRKRGWPSRFRPLFWAMASRERRQQEEAAGRSYQALLDYQRPPDASTCMAEIERDLGRTLPGVRGPAGEEDYFSSAAGQEKLRHVLAAFAAYNPTVGYCQSMNFVAALLLLQLQDEEVAFWVLATVVNDILPHYYHRSLYGLRVDQEVLAEFVEAVLPKVHQHFQALSFDLAFVSTNWLLCIFINSLPWDCVERLVDILLYDASADILIRASLALLLLLQPKVLACRTQEELFHCMKPKGGVLTLEKGAAIAPGKLMQTIFTKLPPLRDLAARRCKALLLHRQKTRFSCRSTLLSAGDPQCGI